MACCRETGHKAVFISCTYLITRTYPVWGTGGKRRLGVRLLFLLLQITSEHCFCPCREREKTKTKKLLQHSLLFAQTNETAADTLRLGCDSRSAWHLLWYGGTVTLLGSWLLAPSQTRMHYTTLNNPASVLSDTESISLMNYPCTDNQINLRLTTCSRRPCKVSQVTAQIKLRPRIMGGMDSSGMALWGHADIHGQFSWPE